MRAFTAAIFAAAVGFVAAQDTAPEETVPVPPEPTQDEQPWETDEPVEVPIDTTSFVVTYPDASTALTVTSTIYGDDAEATGDEPVPTAAAGRVGAEQAIAFVGAGAVALMML